jgi:hypothetical protein
MTSNSELFKKTIKYHGVGSAFHIFWLKVANKIVTLKILRCAELTKMAPSEFELDPSFQIGFLDGLQISNRFGDGFNDIPAGFSETAVLKGDKCICIIDDSDKIAGYSWFSNKDTPAGLYEMDFIFDPSFIYTYKVFTETAYRGKRLHRQHMNLALSHFQKEGFKGIVCHIYSDNFDSLKSSYRMGFKDVGSIYVVKFLGKVYHFRSPTCKKHKIGLK